jgi:hypothetical protein
MNASHESYTLVQDSRYVEDDWWRWGVWVEGSEKALNQVDYVEYTLHPTFVNPVRKVSDRATRFRLEEEGWGAFTLYAKLLLKDGTAVMLEHNLELALPEGGALPPPHIEKTTYTEVPRAAPVMVKKRRRIWPYALMAIVGIGVVLVGIGVFMGNNDAVAYNTSATDTASFSDKIGATAPDDVTHDTATVTNENSDTTYKPNKPLIIAHTPLQKKIIDSISKTPGQWLQQVSFQLAEKDRQIVALQKEVDSLKQLLQSRNNQPPE